jgi:CDI immunity proteins
MVSFASLDREKGLPGLPTPAGEEYPLPAWHRAVYNIPIDELGVEDICKACRQQIHLEHTVPRALDLLKADPLAGEMFDGELLVAMKSVPQDYWVRNEAQLEAMKSVAESALRLEAISPDVREEAQDLLKRAANQKA